MTFAAFALVSTMMTPFQAVTPQQAATAEPPEEAQFEVVVPSTIHAEPVTGRVFVFIAKDAAPEPRLQAGGVVSVPFFGANVTHLTAGTPGIVGLHAVGYPYASLDQLPAGDYYVQAMVSVYTRFPRADGAHDLGPHG